MNQNQPLSSIVALLWLQQLITALFQKEISGAFAWNPKTIRLLSEKIFGKIGYRFSDRALRMTVAEPVTSKTKIPRLSGEKSRLDAVSIVLGFNSFKHFMQQEAVNIAALHVVNETKDIQTLRMDKGEKITFYTIANSGQEGIKNMHEAMPPFFKYGVCYYLTDATLVFTAFCEFDYNSNEMLLQSYLIPFGIDGTNSTCFEYKGKFSRYQNGYLDFQVRHPDDPSSLLYAVIYTNTSITRFRFAYGTYIARSMATNGCYAGKAIIEFFDSKEEALARYKITPDANIVFLLQQTRISTPHLAFYTLKGMREYNPSDYKLILPE